MLAELGQLNRGTIIRDDWIYFDTRKTDLQRREFGRWRRVTIDVQRNFVARMTIMEGIERAQHNRSDEQEQQQSPNAQRAPHNAAQQRTTRLAVFHKIQCLRALVPCLPLVQSGTYPTSSAVCTIIMNGRRMARDGLSWADAGCDYGLCRFQVAK